MTKVEYYTKNKKVYHFEPTAQEAEELKSLRRKSMYARKKQAERDYEQHVLEHSKGYCPKCFLLIPLTGVCPNCN